MLGQEIAASCGDRIHHESDHHQRPNLSMHKIEALENQSPGVFFTQGNSPSLSRKSGDLINASHTLSSPVLAAVSKRVQSPP
jgi:hypothetical protein